jgi:hypothetical protein
MKRRKSKKVPLPLRIVLQSLKKVLILPKLLQKINMEGRGADFEYVE